MCHLALNSRIPGFFGWIGVKSGGTLFFLRPIHVVCPSSFRDGLAANANCAGPAALGTWAKLRLLFRKPNLQTRPRMDWGEFWILGGGPVWFPFQNQPQRVARSLPALFLAAGFCVDFFHGQFFRPTLFIKGRREPKLGACN